VGQVRALFYSNVDNLLVAVTARDVINVSFCRKCSLEKVHYKLEINLRLRDKIFFVNAAASCHHL